MYFFESKAKSPFKDNNDYLYAQLKQNIYEKEPLLHYAMNHLLCKSIEELHNTHPHHPETLSELEEKIPWLVWMLDKQPPGHPMETLLLETYTYYITDWRSSYMPIHAKLPQAYLRQVLPGITQRCAQLLDQWPPNSVPAGIVLERIYAIINTTTDSCITYEDLLLANTLLHNLEDAFTADEEEKHLLLIEIVFSMNVNTNAFATWYQQYFQQLLEAEADTESRHLLILQQQYKLQMAPFNVRWIKKPYRKTDIANPVLYTLLAPFLDHQLRLLEKTPASGAIQKLPLGKNNVFEIAVIFRILFQQLGLENRLPLKVLYVTLCSILSFTGVPIVNPESFASYAQAKHHTIPILDNVINFFNECRLAAEKLRRALRKLSVKP